MPRLSFVRVAAFGDELAIAGLGCAWAAYRSLRKKRPWEAVCYALLWLLLTAALTASADDAPRWMLNTLVGAAAVTNAGLIWVSTKRSWRVLNGKPAAGPFDRRP